MTAGEVHTGAAKSNEVLSGRAPRARDHFAVLDPERDAPTVLASIEELARHDSEPTCSSTNRACAVVDTAPEITCGAGTFKRSRCEQLFRGGRLGRIHPGNTLLTHELVGKLSLDINPDEQPRWG